MLLHFLCLQNIIVGSRDETSLLRPLALLTRALYVRWLEPFSVLISFSFFWRLCFLLFGLSISQHHFFLFFE